MPTQPVISASQTDLGSGGSGDPVGSAGLSGEPLSASAAGAAPPGDSPAPVAPPAAPAAGRATTASGDRPAASSAPRGGTAAAAPAAASASADPKSPGWHGKRVGRFRLIGLIGRGAMGKVFRAEDPQLHRLVALKVISSRSSRRKSAGEKLEMLLREARAAAKLEHPNIVSVYEVSSAFDIHFIAMELVEGGNLKDLVTAAGPLDVARACQLAADAAEGLHHAHEQGVVHRDVKPANLMLTRSGRCKLADFGLARADDRADDGGGGAVGTPQFVSPEVAHGDEATALSDVYSLGATLFFLLTGTPPFPGENSKEVVRRHMEELPPDVRTLRPDVPEGLALAIWRSMSKQPTARFDSAAHFARVLRVHTLNVESSHDAPAATAARGGTPPALAAWLLGLDRRQLALGGLLGGGLLVAVLAVLVVLATRGGGGKAGGPVVAAAGDVSADNIAGVPLPRPGQLIAATDTPTLLRVARELNPAMHDGTVVVDARVVRVELRRGENVYRIDLRGVDRRRGLACVFAPDLLKDLGAHVGGDPVVVLAGRRVQIIGTVDLSDGQPLIEVRAPGQVRVVD